MPQTLIVVDAMQDWEPFYPSDQVIPFRDYLDDTIEPGEHRLRIINLCKGYRYLGDGYYCSLLAEARGHSVIPSVRVINDVSKKSLYRIRLEDLDKTLESKLKGRNKDEVIKITSYFGTHPEERYRDLARRVFDRYPCPILEITLRNRSGWRIDGLRLRSPHELDDDEQTAFAEALDHYSRKVWRNARRDKRYRYDMSILVNPEECLPPSNGAALKKFIRAGKALGINVELIQARDLPRLAEYDALFIRETTAIDHHTYQFARKAQSEGLVVIDDPDSILRCTNKVYLADLFRTHGIPAPRSRIVHKASRDLASSLEQGFGYPMIVKIPDGSFSRGVVKVEDRNELEACLKDLFRQSALLLVQEFLYTDYDWRIGVLNRKPLYACRYFMVKDHWQIYRHGSSHTDSGDSETVPIADVPRSVIRAALAATAPIGDGFYGVDLKEKDGNGYVIEVNDNPNIDTGVEDSHLGDELYDIIMREFLRRIEARG
jgi:glutathione synthase/RimK-type ligase-like ATP-grasp enzyme